MGHRAQAWHLLGVVGELGHPPCVRIHAADSARSLRRRRGRIAPRGRTVAGWFAGAGSTSAPAAWNRATGWTLASLAGFCGTWAGSRLPRICPTTSVRPVGTGRSRAGSCADKALLAREIGRRWWPGRRPDMLAASPAAQACTGARPPSSSFLLAGAWRPRLRGSTWTDPPLRRCHRQGEPKAQNKISPTRVSALSGEPGEAKRWNSDVSS